jgi:phage repressor protein C with HTH and peptisase S24 domain
MNQIKRWVRIVEAIRRESANTSQAAVARLLEVSPGYISRILNEADTYNGGSVSADNLAKYELALGLACENVLPAAPLEGFGLVRRVKAMLGAGSSLVTDDEPDGFYAFRLDFLNRLGLKAKPVLFGVIGDSMEPTLRNGDTVLIDEADKTIRAGQLYGVGIGDELHIKRVFVKPDGTVVLKSDNPDHPTWEIPKDERPRIVGRARWVGRIL